MKPFLDGEYTKECLLVAAKEIAPKKVKNFRKISLSHQTVPSRIHVISNYIYKTLETAQNLSSIFHWLLMTRRILLIYHSLLCLSEELTV